MAQNPNSRPIRKPPKWAATALAVSGGIAVALGPVFAPDPVKLFVLLVGLLIGLVGIAAFFSVFADWMAFWSRCPRSLRFVGGFVLLTLLVGVSLGYSEHLKKVELAADLAMEREALRIETESLRKANDEVDRLQQRERDLDSTVVRLMDALEIAEGPNVTSLVRLTNNELKAKATTLYTAVRGMNQAYNQMQGDLLAQRTRAEITEAEYRERDLQLLGRATREYEAKYMVDMTLVRRELEKRVPVDAQRNLTGIPMIDTRFRSNDPRSGSVPFYELFPAAEFAFELSGMIVTRIEELTKLLPND